MFSVLERYAALFSPTNIWAEDEGLARRARRVGMSVLVKKKKIRLSWRQIDRREGMYALVVMIMLIIIEAI